MVGLHVLRLRGDASAADVARRGLGDKATPNQIRNFANYIARMERGEKKVQNPTFKVLERLARGLGVTVTDLVAQVEGVPTLLRAQRGNLGPTELASAVESDTPPKADSLHDAEAQQALVDSALRSKFLIEALIQSLASIPASIDRLTETVTRVGASPRQAPSPRPRSPKARKHGARRDSKTT